MPPETRTLLRCDLLGTDARLERSGTDAPPARLVERDTGAARWGLRRLARRLAAREARVLEALARVPQVPRLAAWDGRRLHRSWIDGSAMHRAPPPDRHYFREALRLLRHVHAAGIVHTGLAQAPNWLVTVDGRPALFDFRFALRPRYRGRRFRTLAYEDLRDLLAHKCASDPGSLTARQRKILARRSWCANACLRTAASLDLSIARLVLRRQGSIFSNSSVGASPGRK